VKVADGRVLTPQQAFGAYYRGDIAASIAIDHYAFFDNPSCHYLGKPAPPMPPPPPPCEDFSGHWYDNTSSLFAPLAVKQTGCTGSFADTEGGHSFTAKGDTMTTSKDFKGGITGVLRPGAPGQDALLWSNGAMWERNCSDFAGDWSFHPGAPPQQHFIQASGTCAGGFGATTYSVHGNTITTSLDFYNGLTGVLSLGAPLDTILWANGAVWDRKHTQ